MPLCNGPLVDDDKYLSRTSQARLSRSHFEGALCCGVYLTSDTQTQTGALALAWKSPEYIRPGGYSPFTAHDRHTYLGLIYLPATKT